MFRNSLRSISLPHTPGRCTLPYRAMPRYSRNKAARAKDKKDAEEKANIPYSLEERVVNGQKVMVKVYPKPVNPYSYELPTKPPWVY